MSKKDIQKGQINEEVTPNGLKAVQDANKVTKKESDAYYKSVKDKVDGVYGKKGTVEVKPVKVEYDSEEKTYHDEMETLNGMEMIEYDNEPSDDFKERAKEGITGSSRMGNERYSGEWNPETGEGSGNTDAVWEASNDEFGEELLKRVEASKKKRDDSRLNYVALGSKIMPKDKPNVNRALAFEGTEIEYLNSLVDGVSSKDLTNYMSDLINEYKTVVESISDEKLRTTGKIYKSNSVEDKVKYKKAYQLLETIEQLKELTEQKLMSENTTKKHTHFAVSNGKIVEGFDFQGKSKTTIKENVETLVMQPLKDILGESFNKKDVKLYSSRGLVNIGLNESDSTNWVSENDDKFVGTHVTIHKPSGTIVDCNDYSDLRDEDGKYDMHSIKEYVKIDVEDNYPEADFKWKDLAIMTIENAKKKGIDLRHDNSYQKVYSEEGKLHESQMRRLVFKKPFTNINKTLTLIPESYKKDNHKFEMTDGNQKYLIRWEGNLNEGTAIVLEEENKEVLAETFGKMKHLMAFNGLDKKTVLQESKFEDKFFNIKINEAFDTIRETDKIENAKLISESKGNNEVKDKFKVRNLEFSEIASDIATIKKAKYITEGKSYEGVEYHIELKDTQLPIETIKESIIKLNNNKKPSDRTIEFKFYNTKGEDI